MKHIERKAVTGSRATNRPSSAGGSLVFAESWAKPEKGSKTADSRSVAMMTETRGAFVDAFDRTMDPSLVTARIADGNDRDFGRAHTSYVPGAMHSRAGKSAQSSRRGRTVDRLHVQFTYGESSYDDGNDESTARHRGSVREPKPENWSHRPSTARLNKRQRKARLIRQDGHRIR